MELASQVYGVKSFKDFSDIDVFIICVSTHNPHDISSPEVEGLLSLAESISIHAKAGALLSIESTIPKGTSKKMFELLEHKLHVVHAPHRWYALEEDIHGVNQLRVIGGVSDCCLKKGIQFYRGERQNEEQKCLGIPMHAVPDIEIAELTKIIENANRYMQIAFAEDLYLYCQANNISFSELRNALNTKWNVNILEPRDGIGGHCLPKDTRMFLQSSKSVRSKLLFAAMEVDMQYRNHLESKKLIVT